MIKGAADGEADDERWMQQDEDDIVEAEEDADAGGNFVDFIDEHPFGEGSLGLYQRLDQAREEAQGSDITPTLSEMERRAVAADDEAFPQSESNSDSMQSERPTDDVATHSGMLRTSSYSQVPEPIARWSSS